ncbi:putative gustatory receptor 28b [Culex pipiens pallens]|uniref:putative gustatory receptor 28b n=1 Tax=Culex pipiens pallens TaxID=42434 RepID=UPI0019539778|nr:putative gustatory receptor 28b [Culex pipiens pallens]
MRWFEVQDYIGSLRPIYIVSKACLVHFSTLDLSTATAQRTLFGQVRLVFTVFMDIFLFTFAIRSLTLYLEVTDSLLLNGGLFASLALTFIFSTILPLWNSHTDVQMYQLYKNIAICDVELLNLGFTENHSRHHMMSIILLCNSMMMVAYIMIAIVFFPSYLEWLGVAKLFPSGWTTLSYVRTNLVMGVFVTQTTLTLHSLRKRFQMLNQAICKYLPNTIQSKRSIPNPKLTSLLIWKFTTLHDLLSDTVNLYNCCYSPKAIFIAASYFGLTLFSWFGLIHAFTASTDVTTFRMSVANVVYDCFFLVLFGLLVSFSCLVNRECHRTAILLHKVVCYGSFDRRTTKQLRCFSQQLWHQLPKISSRLFDFEWELFYHTSGALATYLVILIQFDLGNINYKRLPQGIL